MGFALECEMLEHVRRSLQGMGYLTTCEVWCGGWGRCDIVAAKFGLQTGRFIPDCEALMAVELKLDDVAGVMMQCRLNKAVVNFSIAAMPRSRINRMRSETITKFFREEIGLLAVDDDSGECEFCVFPEFNPPRPGWEETHEKLVSKVWRYVRREYHAAKAKRA